MMPDYKTFKGCEHAIIPAIIRVSDLQKGMILDPFAGSGTTAVSAVRSGFDYMMFDISPEQCEFAEARIEYNVGRNKEN
jgi:DNA modification methylase